jgi:Uma2 family endonuclease
MAWAVVYEGRTPGTLAFDNTTHILGEESEPQPDVSLLIVGGQTKEDADGYIVGAPELVVEVASSSVAIDLHAKKRDYERHGVQEYVVVIVRDARVLWFVRNPEGKFVEMPPDGDQIHRSRQFPGLWLDGAALLRGDTTRVLDVLNQGITTPEHAAFSAALAARGATTKP